MNEVSPSPEQIKPLTYLEQGTYPSEGVRVTVVSLEDPEGMFIAAKHMDVRRAGVDGMAVSHVAGHGGDVWFVQHNHEVSEIGAYSIAEIAPLSDEQTDEL